MRPGLTTVVSFTPSGSSGRALGQYGHLSPPVYSWTTPGGCEALSCTFARPPRYRTDALDGGRMIKAYRGGSVVWEGVLDEGTPTDKGWQLQAHGAGSLANDYRAIYSGAWDTGTPDDVVNQAISRGLDWVNPGIGNPSGMWIGQKADSASATVTDILNLVCNKGGLTWLVKTQPGGNYLSVVPLPTAPNRLLVSRDPAPRSVAAGPTTLYVRYQSTWDTTKTPAKYALTSSSQAALEAASGRREEFLDLSSAGVRTQSEAQSAGSNAFKQFTRAAFTEPFAIRYGSLRNLGGQAVDPGAFYTEGQTGMVCKLLLADYTPASDALFGPPVVLIGRMEWDDSVAAGSATPFESLRHDFASLLSMIGETTPVRTQPVTKKKKK